MFGIEAQVNLVQPLFLDGLPQTTLRDGADCMPVKFFVLEMFNLNNCKLH